MMLVDIAEGLAMAVRRRHKSGWGLAEVSQSWVGSRHIEREEARCMRHSRGDHRMQVVRLVSWRLRGGIRSLDGP
jgi:hypothetical protein